VRKLGDSGTIDVALLTADGQPVATPPPTRCTAPSRPHNGAGRRLWISAADALRLPEGSTGQSLPARESCPAGNATPALGNPVPPFQQSPVPAP
jgi:hypothetical protein